MLTHLNNLFIASNIDCISLLGLSARQNNFLITHSSNLTAVDSGKLTSTFKEIITVDHYLSTGEVELKAKALHQQYPLDRIIIFSEEDILRAAKLRELFHLKGQSYESALAFRDKAIMKDFIKKAGLKLTPYSAACSYADVLGFCEKNSFPVVIKPARGVHSQKTYVLQNEGDLTRFIETPGNFDECHASVYLIEKFVEGVMYQIDGVVRDGQILAVWPSRYINSSLNLLKGEIFGSHILSSKNPLTSRLIDYAHKVIAALPNDKDMIFHLEAFHTPQDEIIFCEIASRIGGGSTRDFWMQAFDIDLREEFVKLQSGQPPSQNLVQFSKHPEKILGIIIYPPREGITPRHIEAKCPFPWVDNYQLNCKVGVKMSGIQNLEDYMALISISAPDETVFTQRFNEFNNWFEKANIFEG